MPIYNANFSHADEIIRHLDTVVPGLQNPTLEAKYAGFVAIAAITVYEVAIKEIFIEFARRKHMVLGSFTVNHFNRINGKVSLKNLRDDHIKNFGQKYLDRFNKNLDKTANLYLGTHRRDIKNSYGNLVVWRNTFAHAGNISTSTYSEVVHAYEDGKKVIECLAHAMQR